MAGYLTETVYQRWYQQHQLNLSYCIDLLHHLRSRLEVLPYGQEVEGIESLMDIIDNNIEKIRPRNFTTEPLVGAEKFFENMKVLANLLLGLFGNSKRFKGIYQSEKERILKNHQDFKFKDNLRSIREMIELIEEKQQREQEIESEMKMAKVAE